MAEFIKYPSIEQFRSVVRNVNSTAEYQGFDIETLDGKVQDIESVKVCIDFK